MSQAWYGKKLLTGKYFSDMRKWMQPRDIVKKYIITLYIAGCEINCNISRLQKW